ncbi:MAG: acetate/propionate family kinase, partial [Gaiellaceae bacterium]
VDDFVEADAVGHRVVHLGGLLVEAALVDDSVIPYIEEGAAVAPLHNQPALDALRRAQQALPNLPHVAVSDSYFHHTMPDYVRTYAIPADWKITRQGFHGLAVRSIAERTPAPRLVVCHLGGGASVTAVLDGRSVDTTMGYTPLEGLPMATRSGSVDPGALLYLLREGMPLGELDRVLNEESGLRALGGLDDPLGFAVYTYRVAQAVSAMATALGGIDTLAFSGGVGENRSDVREAVLKRTRFLGDFGVEVAAAREDVIVARHVRTLLAQ